MLAYAGTAIIILREVVYNTYVRYPGGKNWVVINKAFRT